MSAERWLVILLRFNAIMLFFAAFSVVMPFLWMIEAHDWLGMGTLPEMPVIAYLIRTISCLYFIIGVLTWLFANEVHRYRPLIFLSGWSHMGFGVAVLFIDIGVHMPWWWIAMEGPSVFSTGLLMLLLLRKIPSESRTHVG